MSRAPLLDDLDRIQELADHVVPITLRAVCSFGVPDMLREGPRAVDELAAASGTNEDALYRALRALATKGLFSEVAPRSFALAPLGRLLRTDGMLALGDAYPLLEAELVAWAHVEYTLTTGRPAFEHVFGRSYYEYVADHPDHGARFDRAVERQNTLVVRTLLHAYDWAGCGTIVDVGSGNGSFLAGLLARHRTLRGVAFDLPHVVAGAPDVLQQARVADRCEVVAGSFLDEVPAGGDTYVLKTILHDLDDDAALALLRRIGAALPAGGTLLVIEAMLAPGDDPHIGKILDLYSLVLRGGRERTEAEICSLVAAAGLKLRGIVPSAPLAIAEVGRGDG
jgi:hypothetical protein